MGLSLEQQDALGDLPVGTAVIKMQDRFTKPFKIKIPFVPVKKLLRSEIPRSKYACSETLRTSASIPANKEVVASIPEIPPQIKENREPELTMEISLLMDIARNPISTIVDRYGRLGMSPRKGNLAKRYLVREDLIIEKTVHGKNGYVKLIWPSENGEQELKKRNIKFPNSFRHGGLEHKYWIQTIADTTWQTLGDNYEVLEEYPIGQGKSADIVIVENGNVVSALEIETGKSDVQANIDKYTGSDIEKVIIAFTNQKILDKFKDTLRVNPKITLTTVSKIAKAKKEELI